MITASTFCKSLKRPKIGTFSQYNPVCNSFLDAQRLKDRFKSKRFTVLDYQTYLEGHVLHMSLANL